jgi:hypothetical protein
VLYLDVKFPEFSEFQVAVLKFLSTSLNCRDSFVNVIYTMFLNHLIISVVQKIVNMFYHFSTVTFIPTETSDRIVITNIPTFTWEIQGLNICRETCCTGVGCPWYSSVPPGKF